MDIMNAGRGGADGAAGGEQAARRGEKDVVI